MPMPHRTQMQLIKRRLVGKEGSERIRELRTILGEAARLQERPVRGHPQVGRGAARPDASAKRVTHRDSIAVRREGAAQIALVGPPNAGKSSLLQALSNDPDQDGRVCLHDDPPGARAHTSRRRARAARRDSGADRGARPMGRGGARPLLGVLRGADAILFCHDASAPVDELPGRDGRRGGGGRNRAPGA